MSKQVSGILYKGVKQQNFTWEISWNSNHDQSSNKQNKQNLYVTDIANCLPNIHPHWLQLCSKQQCTQL